MAFLFFGALVVLVVGFAQMNWLALLIGGPAFFWCAHKLDERQQAENRARWEAMRQENIARSNGKAHGNVEIVARRGDS